MIFWSLCVFIWFKNIEKMLLQMTSGFLQLESTIVCFFFPFAVCTINLVTMVTANKLLQ
jgi:hypothetical protein